MKDYEQGPPRKDDSGYFLAPEPDRKIRPFRRGARDPGGTQFPGGTRFPEFVGLFSDGLSSAPPFSTHKIRSGWFHERASFPFRDAPGDHVELVATERRRRVQRGADERSQYDWKPIGPTNIGGRVTAVAVDPDNEDVVYAGAAGGGVWRSSDAGQTWDCLWNGDGPQVILNVGALAIGAGSILYCATGEANLSADNYPGDGIYVSADRGRTWKTFAAIDQQNIDGKPGKLPRRIGTLAVHPEYPQQLWIGGVTHNDSESGGMLATRDGGKSWTYLNLWDPAREDHCRYWCHSIVFVPRPQSAGKDPVILAAIDARGAFSGIWRSEDSGKTWEHITDGLPPGFRFARTSLAVAPTDPGMIYALAADRRDGVLGVFRSRDYGQTWTSTGWDYFIDERQMYYANCIAVHPRNSSHVICGGIDLHRTTDGGQTWSQITESYACVGDITYAHADHHAVVITASGRVYDGNDGGIDVSYDGGTTWHNRSNGLAITMFYDVDVAPEDAGSYGGGTQDNGTVVTERGRADQFQRVLGGDGGWMVFNPAPSNAPYVFASAQRMRLYRYTLGGDWENVTPDGATPYERRSVWMAVVAAGPYERCGFPRVLYTGSSRIWRSQDDGGTWEPVSPILDGSPITAIDVHSTNPRHVYVGTTKGGIFRSVDGGNTWSDSIAGTDLPGRIITRIDSFVPDPEILVATIGGASVSAPYSHVFLSTDGGRSWLDVDRGGLPNAPHYAVVIEPERPHRVFVSSDCGVYMTYDVIELARGGRAPKAVEWRDISGTLPYAIVVDLVHHAGSGTLTAATYGRSLWRLQLDGSQMVSQSV